jgi:hypothetical protein
VRYRCIIAVILLHQAIVRGGVYHLNSAWGSLLRMYSLALGSVVVSCCPTMINTGV